MNNTVLRQASALLVLVALMLISSATALAQPSGARGDDFIYRIMPNDTLINLSNQFTGTESNWPVLQKLNNVADPFRLQIGREIRIPFELIPEVPAQGHIVHTSGRATLNNQSVKPGDTVAEGDVLSTQEHSFLTIELPDSGVAAIPASSTLTVTRLRTFQGTGLIDAILSLENGAVDSTVAPESTGTGRYEIRTPVSITGVRGTRLRVRTGSDGSQNEVLSGVAQLGHQNTDGPRLQANQGAAVGRDGQVFPVRPLLGAPTLHQPDSGSASGYIAFDPVPGASAYVVRVAADPAGTQVVSSGRVSGSPARYQTPGPGTWYVLVRAVDDLGLAGIDAHIAVDGHPSLHSGFGLPIHTRFGLPVLLGTY